MKSQSVKAVAAITSLAPQFLVDDLSASIAYYRDRLGFKPDFVYDSFYASVSRDGFSIHLKCAPKTLADRAHRKQNAELETRLTYEPMTETPNRKRLRPNDLAEWELRVGKFRVFYDVDQENDLIKIEAVGYKEGAQLFIRGKEYQL